MEGNNLSEGEIVEYLYRILDNRFVKFILKEMVEVKKIEKSLGIYAGVIDADGFKEKLYAKIVGGAIERGAERFGVESDVIKNFLKDPYMRKGFAVIMSSIAEYGITRPQRLIAPFMVVWDFTKQCNLRCKHCYANTSSSPADDELNLEERKQIVDQLDETGVAAISFSGGEPLVNKDLWEVAKYASGKGFYLSVATNGTLITKENAKRLRESGIRYVEVSLDGPKDVHDEFRGIDGAFDRSVAGIKNARDAGLSTGIAMTVTRYNLETVPEMIKFARNLKVDRFIVFNFIPTGRGKDIVKDDLTPEEREELMKYLYDEWQKDDLQIFSTCPAYARVSIVEKEKRNKGTISPTHFTEIEFPEEFSGVAKALTEFIGGCGAGRVYCSVEHNGDIQPCVFIPVKVGNVLRDGFSNVWKNNEIMNSLRDRDAADYACRSCEFRYVCGGCRARAYAYYDNLKGPDPGCILMKEEWKKLTSKEICCAKVR